MMLSVSSPLKNKEIQETLEEYSENGVKFTFMKKLGIKMMFEVTGTDAADAISIAKRIIKAKDWGKVIYFYVASEN